MCLAIPGKVIRVDSRKGTATVDYEAEKREAGTLLLPYVKVGDYVLVQAKMIIQKVPAQEARQFLKRVRST
jgi:hydrogenase expression/formation protein HypC